MNLTNHIKSRYAERIAGRDSTIDVNTYVAQNSEKIETDILKMIDYSEIIYSGMTSSNKDPVNVRLCGTWLIITDVTDRTAITLYKVDFGIGEEFNKLYVKEWLAKLKADQDILKARKKQASEEIDAYKSAISANEKLINEYKGLMKSLETDNASYQEIIENKQAEYSDIQYQIRRDIEALTKRREF